MKKYILSALMLLLAYGNAQAIQLLGGGDGPTDVPEIYVAASNATAEEKRYADYWCDGTGDQIEINLAIQELQSTGGQVVLSGGTFYNRGSVILPSYITLRGQGYESTTLSAVSAIQTSLAADAGSGDVSVQLTDTTGFSVGDTIMIYDSTFSGAQWYIAFREITSIDTSGNLLYFTDQLNATYNVADDGHVGLIFPLIRAGDDYDNGVYTSGTQIQSVVVKNLGLYGNKDFVPRKCWKASAIHFARAARCKLEDLWIQSSSYEGVSFQEFSGIYNGVQGFNTIENCFIVDSAYNGIHLGSGQYNFNVINNKFIDNYQHGIYLCAVGEQTLIRGNQIYGTSTGDGISGIGSDEKRLIINTNHIKDCARYGISISGATNCVVTSNLLENNCNLAANTYSQIDIDSGVSNIINGNMIIDIDSTRCKYGIEERNNADWNIISDNIINGWSTGALSTSGANTITVDNLGP